MKVMNMEARLRPPDRLRLKRRGLKRQAVAGILAVSTAIFGVPATGTARATASSTRGPALAAAEARPTSAQVAAVLTAATPGMARTIVAIGGEDYEAAVYDKVGHINFWKFSGAKWAEIGWSTYPRLEPSPSPLGNLIGRELGGMADATFIATGVFTGDSTGSALAFGKGRRGWGTVAWEPGNVLVPTGAGSTDNNTPGIYFDEQFSGNELETTSLNPYLTTAMNYYPLTTYWSWDASASHFVDVRDTAFTSSTPKWGKALTSILGPPAGGPYVGC
jgi:hypothetical protein